MKKLFFFFLLIVTIYACENSIKPDLDSSYPSEIIENQLQAKYDSARMLIYEAHINIWKYGYPQQELYHRQPVNKTRFSSCELQLIGLDRNQDKNELEMHFLMTKDSLTITTADGKPKPRSIIFINGIPTRIRKSGGGHHEIEYSINDRSRKTFINELKTNYDNLNPWLKQEAKKRGYL